MKSQHASLFDATENPTASDTRVTPAQRLLLRPPRIALALLFVAAVVDGWLEWPRLIQWPWRGLGVVALVCGVGLATWALRLFDRSGTTHSPHGRPEAFVQAGPYRVSRNPMYVGVVLFMVGVGLVAGTPALVFCWTIFAWIIDAHFIPREERALEEEFGDAYRDYRSRVRRWL